MQLETSSGLRRVTAQVQRQTRQKEEADNAAARRGSGTQVASALEDHQAARNDEGRQEGIRLA